MTGRYALWTMDMMMRCRCIYCDGSSLVPCALAELRTMASRVAIEASASQRVCIHNRMHLPMY
jgi:hypothetical protein